MTHASDNCSIVFLKLGTLAASLIVALYTSNLPILAFMNVGIVLLCLLVPDVFREILIVVRRIALGFPFLLLIFVLSALAAVRTITAAVISGFLSAAVFILKIHFVVWANLLFVRTTEPADLVVALGKLRLPRELCLMIVIILRFFLVMFEEAASVYEAQRARGFELRSVLNPSNWLPLSVPFVVNVMKKSHDLAMVLELKGTFGMK